MEVACIWPSIYFLHLAPRLIESYHPTSRYEATPYTPSKWPVHEDVWLYLQGHVRVDPACLLDPDAERSAFHEIHREFVCLYPFPAGVVDIPAPGESDRASIYLVPVECSVQ